MVTTRTPPDTRHLQVSLRARREDFRLEMAFEAPAGITALFGPSGAGKSLTLRHLAGLEGGAEGEIVVAGRTLFHAARGIDLPARHRRMGMVFQDYALFPHLDVAGNVGFGLDALPAAERHARVEALLGEVDLAGYGSRRPSTLSVGERQRVALARALAPEPDLLLLDEPLAALDFRVRRGLREFLLALHRRTGVPMVLVTHSLADVRVLSDHLVVVDRGRVVASGPTDALLDHPPNPEAEELLLGE